LPIPEQSDVRRAEIPEERRIVIVAASSGMTILAATCLLFPTRDNGSNGKING
jgi:hypothetical protein